MQEEEEEIGSPQVVNIDIDKQNKKKITEAHSDCKPG